MAVYVDDMRASLGRMVMCHMVADSSEELHAMAHHLGLKRSWCQHEGTYREHYDISLGKRREAVAAGAIEVSMRAVGAMLLRRRLAGIATPAAANDDMAQAPQLTLNLNARGSE